MPTLVEGFLVVVASVIGAALAVLLWRRLVPTTFLERDSTFVSNTYPIIGLIYGVFLGFTIVITWGHFLDAERSATQEVTRLSELWRDAQIFPDSVRLEIQCRLHAYAMEVIASDWDSMAVYGTHSSAATRAYENIWDLYYAYEPGTAAQVTFFEQSLSELNELGRERRQRGLYAGSEVQLLVRIFVIGGGIITVLFSLLLPVRSRVLQVLVTSLVAGLISFSIFLAFSLQRPFSGDLSVKPDAFENIAASFERRADLLVCATLTN